MVSSLLRLKDWVGLDEAAKHIAEIVQGDVNRGDLYRLALAKRLTLSVHFPSRISARYVEIVAPQGFIQPVMIPTNNDATKVEVPKGEPKKPEEKVFSVRSLLGVYDLLMFGTGRREIENLYHLFSTGLELTDRPNRPGIIVKGPEAKMLELVQSEDENPDAAGSQAHRSKIDKEIVEKSIDRDTAWIIQSAYRKIRADFLERKGSKDQSHWYRPIGRLPEWASLVVRTSSLAAFEKGITDAQKSGTEKHTENGVSHPWGSHNTKLLGLLSEAALKFWSLYDPVDFTTAPTNKQVEEWLVEQQVPQRTAEVIATILRADGLKMGRRS